MRRLSSTLILVAALLCAAAPGAQAKPLKMMWYDGIHGIDRSFADMKALHVGLVQVPVNWAPVAPTRPADPRNPGDAAYQWPAETDAVVARARRSHMRVAIMLTGAPSWANGGHDATWAPTRPADFADFAAAAARHYAGVHLWMIWGEPANHEHFQPYAPQSSPNQQTLNKAQRKGPEMYAGIVDASYGSLKRLSSRNRIIAGMTFVTGHIRAANWVRYMRLPNGRPPRMDMYGHNPFSIREPDLSNPPSPQRAVDMSDLGRFERVVDRYIARPRHKHHIRLFLSEFTIPTALDREFNFHTTRAVQARWIRSAFRVAAKLNVYGLGWIHLYDNPGATSAGLITDSGARKPGFKAFAGA